MEEEQTPVYVWGFDSHISESALFDFFDEKRNTSLASVTIQRDDMNNSLRRAVLIYTDKDEAANIVLRNIQSLDIGVIHISLESFPEEAIPSTVVGNQMTTTPFTGLQDPPVPFQSYPTYQLFPDHQSNLPRQQTPMSQMFPDHQSNLPRQQTPMSQMFPDHQSNLPRQQTPMSQMFPDHQSNLPRQQTPMSQMFPDHQSNLPRQQTPMSQKEVYVGNISSTTTEDQLRTVFSAHGHVENVSIIGIDGAFIKFKDVEGATAAITHLNGFNFDDRVWHVRYWVKDRREEIRKRMENRTTCFVRNFRFDLDEAGLREMFHQCGEVSYCKIRRDPNTGKSRGDGFVEFATPEGASEAMKLDGKLIVGGRRIYVKLAQPKE